MPLPPLKFILLSFLFAGCLRAAAETPAQPPIAEAAAHGPGAFEVRVPAPGPDTFADEILQYAIDAVAAAGGGVVLLGVGGIQTFAPHG